MLLTALTVHASLLFAAGQSPALEGQWRGTLVRDGAGTAFHFDVARGPRGLSGSFGLPDQRVLEYPLDSVRFAAPAVSGFGPGGAFRLEGTVRGDSLTGFFTDSQGKATLRLHRSREAAPYTSEAVRFTNGPVSLAGSLYIPRGSGPFPAVIFLHGSGAELRWGASRYFADYFARRGIAALIYDKRGTGESSGNWRRSTFDDLAGDAMAALALLQTNRLIDGRRIGITGHSQGGTIAPMIAARSPAVAFVISNAGSAIPVWESEINSLRNQVRAEGVEGASLTRADDYIDRMIAVARSGRGWEGLRADWVSARERNEPWAGLLEPPPRDFYFWSFFQAIADFNAADHWRKVTVPVLIVQAERDVLVPVERSVAAMHQALREAGNRDYTFLTLPGAPHNFVIQPAPENGLKWPVLAPGYADLVTAWIRFRMTP